MFDSIRNHKKYLMGFLLILIIPSFVLFGIQGFTSFNDRGETVATVDGHDIGKGEWDQAHRAEAQRLREQMPNIDAKLLDSDSARYATLERMVRDKVLAAAVQKGPSLHQRPALGARAAGRPQHCRACARRTVRSTLSATPSWWHVRA